LPYFLFFDLYIIYYIILILKINAKDFLEKLDYVKLDMLKKIKIKINQNKSKILF
jgi:hypothetical protein